MGIVYFGIPKTITQKISKVYDAKYFVETGTYRGKTAVWASHYFQHVYTIEIDMQFHSLAQKKYGAHKNVTFIHGNSTVSLPDILKKLDDTAVIWLDAHDMELGREAPIPLLFELDAILKEPIQHVIIIDDARLYFQPEPIRAI